MEKPTEILWIKYAIRNSIGDSEITIKEIGLHTENVPKMIIKDGEEILLAVDMV